MRILHVTDCYLPQLGGIEMHVSDLAVRQAAAGHDVRVMTRTAASPSTARLPGPVPVVRLGGGLLSPGSGREVLAYVEREGVDLVHAHLSVASPLAWAGLRAARSHPIVATVHSVVPDSPDLLGAAMAVTGFPTRRVTFTAVSDVAAEPWRRAAGDVMPVHVLPNGIDPASWAGGTTRPPDDTFTVVSVGRFARRKRLRPLLRVLAEIGPAMPPGLRLRTVLVGAGPQRQVLERDVHELGLDEVVELTGALTRDQIRTVLHRSDVYVAPATLESFGIAALEARCAGLPVVAMARGGAGEFVRDGREGFLVADDQALGEAVLRLAREGDLRSRIRAHNSSTQPPMAWPAVLERHELLYAHAVRRAAMPHRRLRRPSVATP